MMGGGAREDSKSTIRERCKHGRQHINIENYPMGVASPGTDHASDDDHTPDQAVEAVIRRPLGV